MGFIKDHEEPLVSQILSFDPYLIKTKSKARGYDSLDAFSYALRYIATSNIVTSFDLVRDRDMFGVAHGDDGED